jgi:acyl-CoA synthetase (AMP-forming)/AMP-acid ligase II
MLNALPTFHISGSGLALMTMAHGGTTVLYPNSIPRGSSPAIGEHRITHAFLVPAMIQAMLMVPGVEQADFSSLVCISYGASPITDKVLVDALRIMKCNFLQVYGLTETSGAITLPDARGSRSDRAEAWLLRACGKAGDGVRSAVVDAAGTDVAEGEVGEVSIRSRQNMKSYWRNAKATDQAYPEAAMPGARRVVPHGRRRLPARGLPVHPRPHQGHDHLGRRERAPGRGRERADAAPRRGRLRDHRRTRRDGARP